MKKLRVSLCLVVCITSSVWANNETAVLKNSQAGQPLTLSVAISKTLQQNPRLYQFGFTRQRLLAERENSDLTPGYELGVELENFAGSGNTRDFDSAEVTLALSSIIEFADKRQSRVAVVDARLEQAELKQQVQTLDILGDLTRAFVRLLATQEEQQLTEEAVALSGALYEAVQRRAKRGAASDADVYRAKSMLSQSRLRQQGLRHEIERLNVSLARYWGQTNVTFLALHGDLFAFGKALRFDELYDKLKRSPALSVLASKKRLKDAEIHLAKSQSQFDLAWQLGVRRLQDGDDTALTAGLSLPLFSNSRNQGKVRAAMADRDALDYQRSDQLLALHDRLYTAYSQRQQFIDAYRLLNDQIIPDLEQAMDITRDAYDKGRLRYQDWIAAQQELLEAKQKRIETASTVLLNQAVIEQLTATPLTN